MKKLALLAATAVTASAQDHTWHAKSLGEAVLYSAIFGLTGILLLIAGFKLFDKAISHVDFEGEIQKGNVAAAILGAGLLIGAAVIIAAAIS